MKPTDLDLHCLSISMRICINNLDQVSWLAENYKWACHLNYSAGQRLRGLIHFLKRYLCPNCCFVSFWKWVCSVWKEFAPKGSMCIPYRVDPFSKEDWCAGKQKRSNRSWPPYKIWRKIYQVSPIPPLPKHTLNHKH